MRHSRSTILVACSIIATGCSGSRAEPTAYTEPARAPVQHATVLSIAPPVVPPRSPAAVRGIGDLVRLARERHPTTEAVRATRDAAIARETIAGAWANPALEVQAGRTHPRQSGVDQDTPYGIALTQRLEWIGKRDARRDAARAETAATEAEGTAALAEVESDVRFAAIALAVARLEAQQAEDDAKLADELRAAVERGHAVGDRDAATVSRARLEAANAAVRRGVTRRSVDTSLTVLRLWCGEDLPSGVPVADVLPEQPPAIDPAHLESLAAQDPRLAALIAGVRSAEARAASERAARTPDVTVGVFADRENEKDTVGLSLGIELPVWNQNNGAIAEAEAQRRVATAELRRRHVEQQRTLAAALGEYESARAEADSMRITVLPLAQETLQIRTAGLAAGDLAVTDLLEARRAALASQAAALSARRRAAESLVRLGQAVGRHDLTPAAIAPAPETAP